MRLDEIMDLVTNTKQQIAEQVIDELAESNCGADDAKSCLFMIDAFEKAFVCNLADAVQQKELDNSESDDDSCDCKEEFLCINKMH